MRTRAAISDFSNFSLPLEIEYYYDDNQFIEVKTLTGNQARHTGLLLVTVLAKTIKV